MAKFHIEEIEMRGGVWMEIDEGNGNGNALGTESSSIRK
jgi:hypothetical protein